MHITFTSLALLVYAFSATQCAVSIPIPSNPHDEEALREAQRQGSIAGAGIPALNFDNYTPAEDPVLPYPPPPSSRQSSQAPSSHATPPSHSRPRTSPPSAPSVGSRDSQRSPPTTKQSPPSQPSASQPAASGSPPRGPSAGGGLFKCTREGCESVANLTAWDLHDHCLKRHSVKRGIFECTICPIPPGGTGNQPKKHFTSEKHCRIVRRMANLKDHKP